MTEPRVPNRSVIMLGFTLVLSATAGWIAADAGSAKAIVVGLGVMLIAFSVGIAALRASRYTDL